MATEHAVELLQTPDVQGELPDHPTLTCMPDHSLRLRVFFDRLHDSVFDVVFADASNTDAVDSLADETEGEIGVFDLDSDEANRPLEALHSRETDIGRQLRSKLNGSAPAKLFLNIKDFETYGLG